MSDTETKTIRMWFVNMTSWQYDDEYYYPSDGSNPIAVFSDRDVAQRYVDEINLRNWKSGNNQEYLPHDCQETFTNFCESRGISCEEGSGNTWEDFLNGDSSMTNAQVLLLLKEIDLSFAHVGIEVAQMCEDWTDKNGGFVALGDPSDERLVRTVLEETPCLDKVDIRKNGKTVCLCESCGYNNAAGSTTCRLCNREIENEG